MISSKDKTASAPMTVLTTLNQEGGEELERIVDEPLQEVNE